MAGGYSTIGGGAGRVERDVLVAPLGRVLAGADYMSSKARSQ